MIAIRQWTGVETRFLRAAYLMPVRQFADLVGVSASTVSDWESKGNAARLRPTTQQLLDRVLAQASTSVRTRFETANRRNLLIEADQIDPGITSTSSAPAIDDPWDIEQRRARLASLTVDEAKLRYLESSALSAISESERQPPLELALRIRGLRLHVEELMKAAQHPPQRARLYAVATYLSGLLGALALDLGRSESARAYAQEAFDLAEAADQPSLQSWARAAQSLVEYYGHNYHDALAYARDGQRFARGGPQSVRLAVNGEARALSRMGDRYGVDEAVNRGLALLECLPAPDGLSPSLAVGVYCKARASANAATAYLAIATPIRIDEFALQALPAFDEAQLHGPQALTRLDLATAALMHADADPEQACQLVTEAIAITDREQFDSVGQRSREFLRLAHRWSKTAAMRDVAELVNARTVATRSVSNHPGRRVA